MLPPQVVQPSRPYAAALDQIFFKNLTTIIKHHTSPSCKEQTINLEK